jgi:Tol biopolymer transport system component
MENSISNLIAPALATAHNKKKEMDKKFYTPDYARFKLQCKKPDGTTTIPYHSYDTHKGRGGMTITDESEGLRKLITLAEKKIYDDSFSIATIFANITTDTRTYINGKLNKQYNVIVWMLIRGKTEQKDSRLRFTDSGVMDVEYMMQMQHMERVLREGRVA